MAATVRGRPAVAAIEVRQPNCSVWRTEIVRHAGKFGELGRPGSFVAAAGFGLRSNAMASGGTVIGFVGTGTMGAPIAGHLVAAGYDVRVHDRSSFAMQAVEGATPVASAAAAASGARCVFLSLPGSGRRRAGRGRP